MYPLALVQQFLPPLEAHCVSVLKLKVPLPADDVVKR